LQRSNSSPRHWCREPAAEARTQRHPGDILVTPELSEQMSSRLWKLKPVLLRWFGLLDHRQVTSAAPAAACERFRPALTLPPTGAGRIKGLLEFACSPVRRFVALRARLDGAATCSCLTQLLARGLFELLARGRGVAPVQSRRRSVRKPHSALAVQQGLPRRSPSPAVRSVLPSARCFRGDHAASFADLLGPAALFPERTFSGSLRSGGPRSEEGVIRPRCKP
jgi:hypothetical protein